MDVTIAGSVLAGVAALATAVVTWVGKRGETNLGRFNSFTDQLQEERDSLLKQLAERDAKITEMWEQRHADQLEITRLKIQIIQLGGEL